jgi:hypothetical protein
MDKRMTYGGNGSHWEGCAEVHWDCKIAQLEAENAALRERVDNLKMTKDHKARVQAVKHMLEQTSFIRKCFALDVFRSYPRLRDEALRILDGEQLDNEEEK